MAFIGAQYCEFFKRHGQLRVELLDHVVDGQAGFQNTPLSMPSRNLSIERSPMAM